MKELLTCFFLTSTSSLLLQVFIISHNISLLVVTLNGDENTIVTDEDTTKLFHKYLGLSFTVSGSNDESCSVPMSNRSFTDFYR